MLLNSVEDSVAVLLKLEFKISTLYGFTDMTIFGRHDVVVEDVKCGMNAVDVMPPYIVSHYAYLHIIAQHTIVIC